MIPIALVYSEFYNNFDGLKAYQLNNDDSSKVMIEDVISKNNRREGMYLTGTGITVNNANMRNNPEGLKIGPLAENEISLAGDVSVTNSEQGILTRPLKTTQGTVYVTGNLISNRNVVGLALGLGGNLTIAVGGSYSGKSGKSGSGSLTACGNNDLDIGNAGGSTFVGSDYTCDTTDGNDLPVCKPCHPGCPSPSPSDSVEFSKTQQMASLMAGYLDDDDDDPILIDHLW